MRPTMRRPLAPLFLLLLGAAPPCAVADPDVITPAVQEVLDPVVEEVAGLAPIPGALIGALAPLTSELEPLLQSALLQNNLTQFSSDVVTKLSAVVAALANAALPVAPFLSPDKEAEKRGFLGEAYNVTTSDGYILGVFRIRSGQCSSYRAAVVLPPAILSNAATFIFIKDPSLAYRLAERCFDVWLISFRGYLFARGHTKLSDKSSEFWDFYAYHWGAIDLPAQLEFVSNMTGRTRLRYMGSDQAATALFFMNHVHGQRYQSLLASCYLYAPIGYLGRLRSPAFATMALLRDALTAGGTLTLHNELAFMNPVVHSVLYNLCARISPKTCYYIFQLLAGNSTEINTAIIPYAFANLLDSTSITGFNYFLQQVGKIKYMAYYDYGPTENMRRYNRSTPENVNLAATTVPCSFYAMGRSTVTVTEDVRDTWLALAKSAQYTFTVLEKYNSVSPFGPVDSDTIYGTAIRQMEADLTAIP